MRALAMLRHRHPAVLWAGTLYALLPVRAGIAGSAIAIVAIGLAGLLRFGIGEDRSRPPELR